MANKEQPHTITDTPDDATPAENGVAPANTAPTESESKALSRLEAFSDGVFAIAITLLVLEIQIPHPPGGQLAQQVENQWPAFIAYIASFLTILVMWLNHHNVVQFINRADRLFFVINGLLLMTITFLNYPTALVAEAARLNFSDQKFATLVYNGTCILIGALYNALWFAARKKRLLNPTITRATARLINVQYGLGIPLYIIAFLLAFIPLIGPTASLLLDAAIALYFMFTGRIGEAPTRSFPRFGRGH